MAGNGQLSASELGDLLGNPGKQLRRDAAEAFNALYRTRVIHVSDAYRRLGQPGDLARGVWSQWAAWERYRYGGGALAAYPGTSNHGWGLAVDLATIMDRQVIDQNGAHFGFSKSWSDAQSEWWHILYKPGVWDSTFPLKQGSAGTYVRQVQLALRARGHSINADGVYGDSTAGAVRVWQRNHQQPVTGKIDRGDWVFMFPLLHPGSGKDWPGATVALQHELIRRGYKVAVDGNYGPGMVSTVKHFQAQNGLTVDGIMGEVSWAKLF